MFRFTIRELLLLTLVVGMGTTWAMDRRALGIVREDADTLARFGEPRRLECGIGGNIWLDVANKYCERSANDDKLVIIPEDEAKLGLSTETP